MRVGMALDSLSTFCRISSSEHRARHSSGIQICPRRVRLKKKDYGKFSGKAESVTAINKREKKEDDVIRKARALGSEFSEDDGLKQTLFEKKLPRRGSKILRLHLRISPRFVIGNICLEEDNVFSVLVIENTEIRI
ncbi:hypothetical protein TNCV_2889501 [Trichonephila clavipes]|nr:hypothetical protein TNCV_2889501 [Trichonephila clavipes]